MPRRSAEDRYGAGMDDLQTEARKQKAIALRNRDCRNYSTVSYFAFGVVAAILGMLLVDLDKRGPVLVAMFMLAVGAIAC